MDYWKEEARRVLALPAPQNTAETDLRFKQIKIILEQIVKGEK
jgi:hypothetical protein